MDHLLPEHLAPSDHSLSVAATQATATCLPNAQQLDLILRDIADHTAALGNRGATDAKSGILRIKSMNPRDLRALVDLVSWFLRSCVRTSSWLVTRVIMFKNAVKRIQRVYRRYRRRKNLALNRVLLLWEAAEADRQKQALTATAEYTVTSVSSLEEDYYSTCVPREMKEQIVNGAYLEHLRAFHVQYHTWFKEFAAAREELERISQAEEQLRAVANLHGSLINAAQQRLLAERARQKLPEAPVCTLQIVVDLPRFRQAAYTLQRASCTAKVRARLEEQLENAASFNDGQPQQLFIYKRPKNKDESPDSKPDALHSSGSTSTLNLLQHKSMEVQVHPSKPAPEVVLRRKSTLNPLTPHGSAVAPWDRPLSRLSISRGSILPMHFADDHIFSPPATPGSPGSRMSLQPLRKSSLALVSHPRASSVPPAPRGQTLVPNPNTKSAPKSASREELSAQLRKLPIGLVLPGPTCRLSKMASSLLPRNRAR